MENASKALIIAGSIIISLVIVSLGILVYKKVAPAAQVDISPQQIEAHNSEYEAYFGDYVSAANTKSLLAKIKTNNTLYAANAESTDEMVPVFVKFTGTMASGQTNTLANISGIIKSIKSSKHYKISVENEGISPDAGSVSDGVVQAPTSDTEKGYYQNGYIRIISISEA